MNQINVNPNLKHKLIKVIDNFNNKVYFIEIFNNSTFDSLTKILFYQYPQFQEKDFLYSLNFNDENSIFEKSDLPFKYDQVYVSPSKDQDKIHSDIKGKVFSVTNYSLSQSNDQTFIKEQLRPNSIDTSDLAPKTRGRKPTKK